MALKGQDLLIALKLVGSGDPGSFAALAATLGMSVAEVHAGVKRLEAGRLVRTGTREILRKPLLNLLLHGVAHVFPAHEGPPSRGIPTAWAAPAMAGLLTNDASPPPVWPDPEGTVRGFEVEPLYRTVRQAIRADAKLYDLLALVDVVRLGRARERHLAQNLLTEHLKGHD